MIRSVADFLQALIAEETDRLNAVPITHAPTIGDMYEGLSADILRRVVPEALGLQIVSGFIVDGLGGMSGQIDCMLVRGDGEEIPYTSDYCWHVADVIAVLEIKKTLYGDELKDAFEHLRGVKDLEHNHWQARRGEPGTVNIKSAQRAFSETTGLVAPDYNEIDQLDLQDQLIFHNLVSEQLSVVRVVLGYHGFRTEFGFRESVVRLLDSNLRVKGFGPGSFPQLIISGGFSIGKANGQPYSAPVQMGLWPFCFSSAVNPLLLLLEYTWTRLDLEFGIGGLWGDDLELETVHPFICASAAREGDLIGWNFEYQNLSSADLAVEPDSTAWEPAYVDEHQAMILTLLCEGNDVTFDDDDLRAYLRKRDLDVESFKVSLLATGLVAMRGSAMELITDRCQVVVLPDGNVVAGEDNTGRMSRWVERRLRSEDSR